jgi:predicted nucleic acid-binding protein
VIAVADSSPLVILAKLGCFDFLKQLFPSLIISTEVHREVVVDGAGLPGASEVAQASWIEVKRIASPASLVEAQQKYPLGAGELSTILLGKELRADAVLLDDHKARKLARDEGLPVRGSVGVLETLYLRGHLADLRRAFQQLVAENVYIDQRLLNHRLRSLGLPLI